MADVIFENSRLATIYDEFDGSREDLVHYLALVKEFNAKSVLDVGCGTGCLALLLAQNGIKVTGVDPAQASLAVAQNKKNSNQVNWVLGEVKNISQLKVDIAVMTGNVAQVFLTDESWIDNLTAIRRYLKAKGHLVFEVRDPAQKAWEGWNKKSTYCRKEVPGEGSIESWCDLIEVSNQLVSFRWTYVFESDGKVISSDSTLRFREKEEILSTLEQTGFNVKDIRNAPDRPGKEFVFISTLI